jgi:Zn-dependent protease
VTSLSGILDRILDPNLIFLIPAILIGITVHEFSHAIVSYKLGDPTPKFQKRLTLNPIDHIDPFGLVSLILVGFGWGRPVQIDPRYYKNPSETRY